MLYLLDLPSDEVLEKLSQRYPQMDANAVRACVGLVRSSSELLITFENSLSRHGLTQGGFLVLTYMNRHPDSSYTPTQLAEALNVSRATMTGLLDGLEAKQLVERGIHTEDRRKMSVRLTEHGHSTMDAILPEYYETIANIMGGLTDVEKGDLVDMLKRISQEVDKLPYRPERKVLRNGDRA